MTEAIERRYTILKYFSDRQIEGATPSGLDTYKAIKALDEGRDIRKEHLFPSLTPIPYYLPSFALPSSPYHNVHLALAPLLEFQEDLQRESPTAQSARRDPKGAPPSLEAREPLDLFSPELLLYGELPPEEELLALLPACRELRLPELGVSCWAPTLDEEIAYGSNRLKPTAPTLDEDKLFSYPPLKRRYV